jgi:hypothetical protein
LGLKMINKIGSTLKILKTASSATDLLMDAPMTEKLPNSSTIIEPKHSDFLYYRARAISSGDFGPMGKDGSRGWNYNGNFDYFPRKELEASYETFVGRNIFLDHNSESSLYSIGKIIDAVPVDDPETGEFYIELVGKIDRTLHPEICRKIETGELNSTSMGCSVDDSMCSVCGNVLHSDADEKCDHMGMNLGKKFPAEIDLPQYNIHKGDMVPCFSINSGIVFNEDSIVGVPADPSAVIKTVLSNMKSRLTKKASLSKEEQLDLTSQMEKLFEKLDENTKVSLRAEFCGVCPPVEKESSMADKNVIPNDEQKKILSKLSALEMEQLESYVQHKTKKANEVINKEVVADAASKEETFLSKIVAKVKNSFAAELLEKKIETVAKEEMKKAPHSKECNDANDKHVGEKELCICEAKKVSAKFQEDKNNVLDSTWSVNEGDKCVLEASLKDIWGAQFALLSFSDQKWATSEAYGKEVISRYTKEGLAKLADLWDVSHKLSKTASEPKLGPSGTYATPTTGTDNKKHSYPTEPKFVMPGQDAGQKGPAAPAHQDMKTDPKFKMSGQEKGQTGPAAPKPMAVKTDYSEPKPEAEGKEVKTTPKNPEEKDAKKSEKEVETSYVAKGTEVMESEEKENKKEEKKASIAIKAENWKVRYYDKDDKVISSHVIKDRTEHEASKEAEGDMPSGCEDWSMMPVKEEKKASLISWTSLTPKAQDFIKTAAKKHIASGMKNAEAVAKAHSEFTAQETIMEKKAADKPVESVDGSTLPDGTKKFDAKPEEAVKGTTVPGGAAPTSAPETSAQGDKEHKITDLTKKPDEAVDGTTLPKDHISNTEKSDESSKSTTFPDSKKEIGDEADSAVKKAAKSESSAPIEAVQDKPALSKATVGDTPESAREGGDLKKDPKDIESVNKKAATEMPTPPEHADPLVDDVKPEHEMENMSLDPMAPKMDAPKEEVSAFDSTETLDIGEGYSASKDKETKEIIVSKDGKEVKRLPDGFGKEAGEVLKLMKAVLGLPAEDAKMPSAGPDVMAPKMDDKKEEPKVEEHPALEEAHEDELGIKESALKVKEAELIKKEAALKAKEVSAAKEEASKKFAAILQTRSERCRKIVAELVEKEQLSYDKTVYEAELKSGAHLLDARKKAFEAAITAKMKEFIALNDEGLNVMEATVKSLHTPTSTTNTKRASRLFVSPQYNEQMSEDEEIAKIFKSMGTNNKPQ